MEFDLDSLDPLRLAVVLCWVDRCFGSWVLLAYSVFSKYHNHPRTNVVTSCCYKRVKGRSHTVEKRISMLPHKPHATSYKLSLHVDHIIEPRESFARLHLVVRSLLIAYV